MDTRLKMPVTYGFVLASDTVQIKLSAHGHKIEAMYSVADGDLGDRLWLSGDQIVVDQWTVGGQLIPTIDQKLRFFARQFVVSGASQNQYQG
jgi:hypothetical protein